MRLSWWRLAFLCFGASVGPEDDTASLMGEYEVREALVVHTCGQAIPVLDPVEFDVTLRQYPNGIAQWSVPRGALVNGTVDHEGTITFTSRSTQVVRPEEPGLLDPGCVVVQDEMLTIAPTGNLDGGVAAPDGGVDAGLWESPRYDTLEGTHRIDLRPSPGSDCTPEVVGAGGAFQALPCAIEYELTATR
jgi:hypothetical protein